MTLSMTAILALIPEPVRMAIIGGLGFLGKSLFDLVKAKPQNRRDDFKAVSDTLFSELDRLSARLDKAEEETKDCEHNHKNLTMQYSLLSKQHTELSIKYGVLIETNRTLQVDIDKLRLRIEKYETLNEETRINPESNSPTDG